MLPLAQSTEKEWRASIYGAMYVARLARHYFAVLFPSSSIEKCQIKSSRGYYTKHREVTGAGGDDRFTAGKAMELGRREIAMLLLGDY
jgi:hypothetical protein